MDKGKSLRDAERKTKLVFNLESPFTSAHWPEISKDDQDSILDLLCSLVETIGQHRTSHGTKSQGKRSKRQNKKDKISQVNEPPPVPPPELCSHVTIGLNSTTRHLESLTQSAIPSTVELSNQTAQHVTSISSNDPNQPSSSLTPLAAVFVVRSSQPSTLHAQLPLLCATASLASPSKSPTLLVTLPRGAEQRLSTALGHPRVGFIGIMEDAPHAAPLLDYVRSHVSPVRVPWLEETGKGNYLPVQVRSLKTFAPVVKKRENSDKAAQALPKRPKTST
ncbi:hypothetical protein L228DRAFT_239547 [Xylona heveae TC161]|uniref:RNase P subunit Pop3 n=1 Tax=Xylona heveae (strain CBS 132557 / TC161) TaxID=1328760 RepID=A0A165FZZ9_XYLHT|nr:hypothetical protein L228DRAFT_239547 [Xylona heveae TC161]KZF21581.1 hypothetical protein L228DRAFT_239547 [Xylona heveae TC161]